MKLSRFKQASAKMSLAIMSMLPSVVRAVDLNPGGNGGGGGAGGTTKDNLQQIEQIGWVNDIINTVAPIVAFVFWGGIFIFAVVFAFKFVMSIVNYAKAPGDDARAKDESKEQIKQAGIALLVVMMMGPLINLILGALGWELIGRFFKLDLSLLGF